MRDEIHVMSTQRGRSWESKGADDQELSKGPQGLGGRQVKRIGGKNKKSGVGLLRQSIGTWGSLNLSELGHSQTGSYLWNRSVVLFT